MASYVTFTTGGDDFVQPSSWVPGQHQPCFFDGDHNAILDERHMELVAGNAYHDTFSIPGGLETAAPSPETDSTYHDWSHASAFGGLDEDLLARRPGCSVDYQDKFGDLSLGPLYPHPTDDYSLHSTNEPFSSLGAGCQPRTQSLDSCLAMSLPSIDCAGGGSRYPSFATEPHPPPSSMERSGRARRQSVSGNNKDRKAVGLHKSRVEISPAPTSVSDVSQEKNSRTDASTTSAEVKNETAQVRDKSDVAQKKRKRTQKGKVCEESNEEILFACPLYRKYPLQNMDCVNRKLTRIRDVKQHLLRRHLAFRCPICKIALPSATRRDEHIQEQGCQKKETAELFGPDGIPQEVHDRLRDCSHRGKPANVKWQEVWEIIFGTPEHKEDPFLGPMMDETARLMRGVWRREKESIVQAVIAEGDGSQEQTEGQAEAMMAMFDKVQDRFETRIFELTNRDSSTEGSPLMTATRTATVKVEATTKLKPRQHLHQEASSPQPDGGEESEHSQAPTHSGVPSLPSGSGAPVSQDTLSSSIKLKHGCAELRLQGHSSTWQAHTPTSLPKIPAEGRGVENLPQSLPDKLPRLQSS